MMPDPTRRPRLACRIGATLLALSPLPAAAEGPVPGSLAGSLSSTGLTTAMTTVLTLFLIAVLLESALATLFNWRPFVETFNARATRPLVAFVVAWVMVRSFGYDAVTSLMDAVTLKTTASPPGTLGEILTAAILSGGSSGVNTMLVALGFREVKNQATTAPTVPADRAWIAIRILRKDTSGDVRVQIGPPDATKPDDTTLIPLAGVVAEASMGPSNALRRFFLWERGRFPGYGGHEIPAMQLCQIVLSARNAAGEDKTVMPFPNGFIPARGAIIDLTATL